MLTNTFFLSQDAAGQSIGNWTFNSTLSGTPGTYNTASIADFSASVPIRTFNGATEYYGENGWPAGSLNTSMYMQFSLTPLAGCQLDISSIVLTMRRSNTGSPAGSGPTSWVLRSSLDGFASDIATGSMTLAYVNYTITPGSSFLNLYTTTTFRLYGYNSSIGSGGNSRFVFDNIRVNGIGYLLPARLGALTANSAGSKVNLTYTVYQTAKNDQYSIERSTDAVNFTAVHTDEESTETAEKKYSYTDDISLLAGIDQLYYRVRLRNLTGNIMYSDITRVKIKAGTAPVKVFTENNQLYITGIFPVAGTYQANVYSTAGQTINRISFTAEKGYNSLSLNLNRQLPENFIIHLGNARGFSSTAVLANK